MTQALYAHTNNKRKKNFKSFIFGIFHVIFSDHACCPQVMETIESQPAGKQRLPNKNT
jgi:hypothetical protein